MASTRKSKAATAAAMADDNREAALNNFLSLMAKDRPGSVRTLSDMSALKVPVYSTGAISLDVALGIGGIPRGRITEIYGPSGGGKTTLALEAAVNCQKGGGAVGFVDAEHALSRELAINMGIDPDKFVLFQPDSGEDAIDMVEKMLTSGAFEMVIVDSVASMTPKAELESEVEQVGMALHARLMSKFMRRVVAHVEKHDVALLLLNQVRLNLGGYGAPEATTGGRAIPFYASIRIEVRTSNSKRIERDKQFIGTLVTAKVIKNKLASPFRTAEYDLIFGKGIDASSSLLGVCTSLGLIDQNGASYVEAATGERIAIGKDKAKAVIASDPEMRERLTAAVYSSLEEDMIDVESVDEDLLDENAEFDPVTDGYASLDAELPDVSGPKFDDLPSAS